MLDYHGDCVALSEFVSALSAASFPDPGAAAAQQRALDAVAAEPGAALLGALVQQVLVQASSDGAELDLLGRAADAWGRARALCNRLGTVRADLEGAMEDPAAPGAADRFNTAAVSGQELANEVVALRLEVDGLRTDALAFRHLPPHPRQRDRGTPDWDWGNLLLARRTDALVRDIHRRAVNDRELSFAVGAGVAYGANVAGSAYVGHTVGGPRRTHRLRERLARNTVGSWFAAHHPAAVAPTTMAERVTFGPAGAPAMPSELETLLGGAIAHTFDLARTAPLPDLQLGYRRLVHHLRLLDAFDLPAVPQPPSTLWLARLYGDPATPPPSLRPQDVDVVGQDGGGVAVSMGPGEPGSTSPDSSDSSKVAKGCGILVLAIILIDLLQAFVQCIGQWANGNTCTFWQNMLLSKLWEQDPPDPRDPTNPGVSQDQLTAVSGAPQAVELVSVLFDAHNQAWEAMERARVFLCATGLIYPTVVNGLPLFEQFTAVPAQESWPHREEADPESTYHLYPVSPLEHPTETASPYAGGAAPSTFLPQATAISLGQWGQIARDQRDSQNRDLDADRGFGHACWTAQNSVHDDPVDVVVLGYDEQ